MTTYKVPELEGAMLDAAVAMAEGLQVTHRNGQPAFELEFDPEGPAHEFSISEWKMWRHYKPSSCWNDGGPIIERERIVLVPATGYDDDGPVFWAATHCGPEGAFSHYIDEPLPFRRYRSDPAAGEGPTPLIAAMRAYVASQFGETVELP